MRFEEKLNLLIGLLFIYTEIKAVFPVIYLFYLLTSTKTAAAPVCNYSARFFVSNLFSHILPVVMESCSFQD